MSGVGPPEIRPWMRATDNAITRLERENRLLRTALNSGQPVKKFAEESTLITSVAGNTGASFLRAGNGPSIQVAVPGSVLVTVTAHVRAVWTNTAIDTAAYGAIGVVVNDIRAESEEEARYWAMTGFKFLTEHSASDQGQAQTITCTRPIILSQGRYTFQCDAIYRHITDGISLEWSRRSLIVEVI